MKKNIVITILLVFLSTFSLRVFGYDHISTKSYTTYIIKENEPWVEVGLKNIITKFTFKYEHEILTVKTNKTNYDYKILYLNPNKKDNAIEYGIDTFNGKKSFLIVDFNRNILYFFYYYGKEHRVDVYPISGYSKD